MRAWRLAAGCAQTSVQALKGKPAFSVERVGCSLLRLMEVLGRLILKHHLGFDSLPDHPLRQKLEIVNTDSTLDFFPTFQARRIMNT